MNILRNICLCGMLLAGIGAMAGGTAHFSHFSYTGNDDYYRDHALPDSCSFYNPILPGWYSDPSICRVGGDYYMVTSTFGYFPGIPLFHSTDLVNWEQIGNVLDRPSQLEGLKGQSLGKGGIYAPHISFCAYNSKYYVITTDVGTGHFYVTADHPSGPWSDPVYLPAIDGIDPSLFFDDNGRACIVYKEDTTGKPKWSHYRCIRFIDFDVASGTTAGESRPLVEEGVGEEEHLDRDEGPHIYKINGRYYLLCAEGGTGDRHSEVVYRSESLDGPYTRWGRNPMLTQRHLKPNRKNPVTCAGHADLVQTPEGEWWAVFLGCRPGRNGYQALGRETFIMPVKWSRDGYPYMTQAEDTVPRVLRREGVTARRDKGTWGNTSFTDTFGGNTLHPRWMSLKGSAAHLYKLGDGISLECAEAAPHSHETPAYIGTRICHHKYEVQTNVRLDNAGKDDAAGIMVLKTETRHLFLAVEADKVSLRRWNNKDGETLASVPVDGCHAGGIDLKAVCDDSTYRFMYRCGGSDEWQLLADGIDAGYVSCERTGGFTGATVGMYAEHRNRK